MKQLDAAKTVETEVSLQMRVCGEVELAATMRLKLENHIVRGTQNDIGSSR